MKVKIGPYINWFGPYQFADLFKYIGFSEETCEKIAEKIPEKPFQYIYSLRKRKVKVKIDRDRKSTRLNSSHTDISRMPSSA